MEAKDTKYRCFHFPNKESQKFAIPANAQIISELITIGGCCLAFSPFVCFVKLPIKKQRGKKVMMNMWKF